MSPRRVEGGRFYGERRDGQWEELADTPRGQRVDAWICRRVVDYPGGVVPAGGRVAPCSRCDAPIVYNPARTVTAPKVCMQCASIVPLPIGG